MKLVHSIVLLIFIVSTSRAQVIIDSANVKTEFSGPFSKTVLTLKIVNKSSVSDSLDGLFYIHLTVLHL
jgi:hypothetical protein